MRDFNRTMHCTNEMVITKNGKIVISLWSKNADRAAGHFLLSKLQFVASQKNKTFWTMIADISIIEEEDDYFLQTLLVEPCKEFYVIKAVDDFIPCNSSGTVGFIQKLMGENWSTFPQKCLLVYMHITRLRKPFTVAVPSGFNIIPCSITYTFNVTNNYTHQRTASDTF
jgi:hypothetical protein